MGGLSIKKVGVCRTPVVAALKNILNLISGGQLLAQLDELMYGDIFHLYFLITLEDGTEIRLEKMQVVSALIQNPEPSVSMLSPRKSRNMERASTLTSPRGDPQTSLSLARGGKSEDTLTSPRLTSPRPDEPFDIESYAPTFEQLKGLTEEQIAQVIDRVTIKADCIPVDITQKGTQLIPVTLNEFIMRGMYQLGDKFFEYDAMQSNCQDFVLNLILANRWISDYKFIKQTTKSLLPKYVQAFARALTDLAAKFSEKVTGHGKF
jgi:hypothetical protein